MSTSYCQAAIKFLGSAPMWFITSGHTIGLSSLKIKASLKALRSLFSVNQKKGVSRRSPGSKLRKRGLSADAVSLWTRVWWNWVLQLTEPIGLLTNTARWLQDSQLGIAKNCGLFTFEGHVVKRSSSCLQNRGICRDLVELTTGRLGSTPRWSVALFSRVFRSVLRMVSRTTFCGKCRRFFCLLLNFLFTQQICQCTCTCLVIKFDRKFDFFDLSSSHVGWSKHAA